MSAKRKQLGTKGGIRQRIKPTPRRGSQKVLFPIVGIGASAGGVEAFSKFLAALPAETGMAFVLVPHLAPDFKSELALVLSRKSAIPIAEAKQTQSVLPNRVYVIPPSKHMVLRDGRLCLYAREKEDGTPRSIDIFLESLAEEHRHRAIGIILSGTADDGTLGLEAIKAEGGFTFAQDSSARYDSMPRNAIASGCVDLILPPDGIARELARMARHPYVRGEEDILEAERERAIEERGAKTPLPSGGHGTPRTEARQARAEAEAAEKGDHNASRFKAVQDLLRKHSGVDFDLYKSNTIQRRIGRRMVLNKCTTLGEYAHFLKRNPKELDALYSDVLISVTSFFRNPEVFDFFKEKVFPKLFRGYREEPIRCWVLGCSTGQEAYSIAMVFDEFFSRQARKPKFQIFTSDLNEALLSKARAGLYTKSLVQDISPERLRRYFVEENGGYRISKSLRDIVVFARQNLIYDPPFSRMDLISCRNVLIYLDGAVHRRIIPTFHYALKPQGVLVLGSSETVGSFNELFEPLHKKLKIYQKRPVATPPLPVDISLRPRDKRKSVEFKAPPPGQLFPAQINVQREADRVALSRYVPPSVLINEHLQVLHFRGDTSAYLKPPSGRPTFSLLHMIKPGLLSELRSLINRAVKHNKPARKEEIASTENGKSKKICIEVVPLVNVKERCYLIFFVDKSDVHVQRQPNALLPDESVSLSTAKSGELRNRIVQLERELAETRDYLQSIQEQYEAINEELQASNEETTSANEELQSTNEELETSKEELESTNEELSTVNEELANRNQELTQSNSDLNNLYANFNMPVILLSRELIIRRFTGPAEKLFNLVNSDIGRSISAIRPNVNVPDLEGLLVQVIETVTPFEREIRTRDGHWHLLRVRPYFTIDRKVDGAVLVAVDIDPVKKSEEEAKTERESAEAILHAAPVPLLVLNSDLRMEKANEAFYKMFKTAPGETEGRLLYQLGNGQWNIPQLRSFLEEIIPRNSFIQDFEVTHDFPVIGRRTLFLNARRLDSPGGGTHRILISIDDFTERLAAQESVRKSELRFRRLFESARDGILLLDPVSRRITDANPFASELLQMQKDHLEGKELWRIGLLKDEDSSHSFFRVLQEQGVARLDDIQIDGSQKREVAMIANRYRENNHEVIQCNIRDVTERRRSETAVRKAKDELEVANRTLEHRIVERTASLETLNKYLREISSRLITAQEDERQRIARELHDEVGSLLVALKMQINGLERYLPAEDQGKVPPIIQELTQHIRQLSLELHPHVLDDLGLKAALEWHVKAYQERTNIAVEFDSSTTPTERLAPGLEIAIFRVIQEALTNVARHAQTSAAAVRVFPENGNIKLEISDQGKGFSMTDNDKGASLGLTGMRERVLLMNGRFEVWSQPGKGTRVTVSLPLKA